MTRPNNKVTLRDLDKFFLNGAGAGIGEVVGGLLGAAGERATTYAVYGVTGAITGYGTEWQRVVAMNSRYRPTTKGQVVMASTGNDEPRTVTIGHEHGRRTNEDELVALVTQAYEDGDPIELELHDGSLLEGVVTGIENTGVWLDGDEWVDLMEVVGATVWSCYSGDERRDYQVGRG